MITTGLGDWGSGEGVPWGVYIGSFIWWVGIAHGGILVSAAVRLFKLKTLKPVSRIAELLTIFALTMAASFILFHLGRPDRVVTSIIPAYPWTVSSSPLVWDVTVITLYFVLTTTYLLLTLRRDIYLLRDRLPVRFTPIYRLLALGYRPEEDEKVERMAWWLALGVILLAPLLLHGGVIPWLFQLLPAMPGWYSAIQGPTFLSIALTSALGGVIFVGYIFRRVYGWEEVIPDSTFRLLGGGLALFAMLFLWFQLQQVLTGVYAPPIGVEKAMEAKLGTPVFWLTIGLVVAAVVYLGAQVLRPSLFNLSRTVIAGLLPLVATLLEKVLFVVEGTMKPEFGLYRGVPGSYWPSWIEVSAVISSVSLVVILFMAVAKVLPVIEVRGEEGK
jgi:molybdopterin-containing oxidoreductase family membrane subunit